MTDKIPTSRKIAKKLGEKEYFTGKKCLRGNIAKRRTSTGSCLCSDCCDKRRESCRKHYKNNKEYYKEKQTKYYQSNHLSIRKRRVSRYKKTKERERMVAKIDYIKNRDARIKAARDWQKKNMDRVRARVSARRAGQILATPAWADKRKIEQFYRDASLLNCWPGPRAEVDHIVPLKSEKVCGLHWEGNMQILWKEENVKKGNRFWPDMPEE